MELRPALLSRLLRVPVRHVVHGCRGAFGEGACRGRGGDQTLPDVPCRRWLGLSGEPAEDGRRRHDHRRAARLDDPQNEWGDGRDREAVELVGSRLRSTTDYRLPTTDYRLPTTDYRTARRR